jgi:hypothetical protein
VTSTTEREAARRASIAPFLPWIGVGVVASGSVLVGVRFGGPALVLWLAFVTLAGALLLFQESLRAVLDPDEPAPDAEGAAAARDALAGLEARKRTALRALKDLEFEHSIHRLSDEDFAALRERYRAEARAAMEAMDKSLGAYLARAESMIERAETGAEGLEDERAAGDAARSSDRKPSAKPALAAVMDKLAESDLGPAFARPGGPVAAEREALIAQVDAAFTEVLAKGPADAEREAARRACAACATSNEPDAVFCKKCGARVGEG